MKTRVRFTRAVSALALACAACGSSSSASDGVIYLNQAWSQDDREWYYHFSQGSALVAYDIFMNLEVAGSQELFRSDANSARLGLLPEAANPQNPDGLPVGFSKTVVSANEVKGWEPGEYAGLACAACHETEWSYRGKRVRIDAGVGRVDMPRLFVSLDDALQTTLTDNAKFDRLAARLNATGTDGKDKLRKRVERDAARVHGVARTLPTPTIWGPGRFDALVFIDNVLIVSMAGLRENWSPGTAPRKIPFLWNAPHGEWAQWTAFAWDPLPRNLGEAMGSYMAIDLHSKNPAEGLFASNAAIADLVRVENQLERLAPPSWPEEAFGKIDRDKAKVGKALFIDHCAGCHGAWPYRWTEPNKFGKRFIVNSLVPETYVGTDAQAFTEVRPFMLSGQFADYLPREFRGKAIVPTGVLARTIAGNVVETAIRKLKPTEEQLANMNGYREMPPPPLPESVWKAAPRDGVWATAPFLHNGSVPNLYEMLIPAAERTKTFCIGREFDPVKVGLDITSCSPGAFVMNTSIPGNSNVGHSFQAGPRGNGVVGRLLKDEERWAIVEYLKSIPEEPGRVTPYGGPPQGSAGEKRSAPQWSTPKAKQ